MLDSLALVMKTATFFLNQQEDCHIKKYSRKSATMFKIFSRKVASKKKRRRYVYRKIAMEFKDYMEGMSPNLRIV